jgi:hypothetical protein
MFAKTFDTFQQGLESLFAVSFSVKQSIENAVTMFGSPDARFALLGAYAVKDYWANVPEDEEPWKEYTPNHICAAIMAQAVVDECGSFTPDASGRGFTLSYVTHGSLKYSIRRTALNHWEFTLQHPRGVAPADSTLGLAAVAAGWLSQYEDNFDGMGEERASARLFELIFPSPAMPADGKVVPLAETSEYQNLFAIDDDEQKGDEAYLRQRLGEVRAPRFSMDEE